VSFQAAVSKLFSEILYSSSGFKFKLRIALFLYKTILSSFNSTSGDISSNHISFCLAFILFSIKASLSFSSLSSKKSNEKSKYISDLKSCSTSKKLQVENSTFKNFSTHLF